MNFREQIIDLTKKVNCYIKNSGITILHIGIKNPDNKQHNTLQVQNNGDMYLVDKDGEIQKIGVFGGGGISPDKVSPIEVIIGTQAATDLGFINNDTQIVNGNFVGHNPEIFIGNVNLYSIDRGDGSPYFTIDPLTPTIAILHNIVLADTDVLKIKFL